VGYALLPSGDMNSQFSAPFSAARYVGDGERTFKAKVTLDSARTIRESNEKDNVKWSEEWTLAGE
jgi:hypothetical protein